MPTLCCTQHNIHTALTWEKTLSQLPWAAFTEEIKTTKQILRGNFIGILSSESQVCSVKRLTLTSEAKSWYLGEVFPSWTNGNKVHKDNLNLLGLKSCVQLDLNVSSGMFQLSSNWAKLSKKECVVSRKNYWIRWFRVNNETLNIQQWPHTSSKAATYCL